jgi:chromosome partitioning protein
VKIAWINEKGGTLKTTLATHSAVFFAAFRGENTLLIDMDPQGQAGKSLGYVADDGPTISDVLLGDADLQDAILETSIPNLYLLPADKSLADVPGRLYGQADVNGRLKKLLISQRKYKNVVIDSPPSIGVLTRNILSYVQAAYIPVNLSFLSLDGAAEMVQTIVASRKELGNNKLKVGKVVPTLYRRTKLANAVLERLEQHFGDDCAQTRIGVSVKVDEAQSWGRTIWQHAPRAKASLNFLELMEELYGKATQDGFALLKKSNR